VVEMFLEEMTVDEITVDEMTGDDMTVPIRNDIRKNICRQNV
jgi:hypothetical protein